MKTIKRHWLSVLFFSLYGLVMFATLRHSAAGFASLEGGNLAWGYLSALAIDAGMALSATGLRKRRSGWLAVGLIVSAILSTYTQLLYSVEHAAVIPIAPGAMWLGSAALMITNARVIILPSSLPILAIVYSFASKSVGTGDGDDLQHDLAEALQRVTALQQERDGLRTEVEQVHTLSPLFESMPQQTRAELYALAQNNGTTPRKAAEIVRVSLASAQRGVKLAHGE